MRENIAVFADFRWAEEQLTYANIQVAVSDVPIDEIIWGKNGSLEYIRLDLDSKSLGKPFNHPFPHLHFVSPSNLRPSVQIGHNGNVIVDFIEFVYQHYGHQDWLAWAKKIWDDYWISHQRDPDENPWDLILRSFEDGNLAFLRQEQAHLQQLKQLLQARKDQAFPHFMNTSDRQLLTYPT